MKTVKIRPLDNFPLYGIYYCAIKSKENSVTVYYNTSNYSEIWSIFFFSATTVTGGPVGGQTRVTLRNDHLQYIFTW